MPKSLDPSSRITMVLACDQDKPEETQPRIFARTLTLNQQRQMMVAMHQMQTTATPEAKIDAALDTAEICLTGWENMVDPESGEAITFSREAIGNVLSMDELAEVFSYVTEVSTTSLEDKKKSE